MESAMSFRLSYRRLRQEGGWFEHDGGDVRENKVAGRLRSTSGRSRKVQLRKRSRIKIPRLMAVRRFLRKRAKLLVAACAKTAKRLKESKSHFGDLFAGNYLFLQVTPTPFKSPHPHKSLELLQRACGVTSVAQRGR